MQPINAFDLQINALHHWHGSNIVVLFVKKHKNGHGLDTMCTPGFAESFMGTDAKRRPDTGKAVLNLFLTEFKSMLCFGYFFLQIVAYEKKGLRFLNVSEYLASWREGYMTYGWVWICCQDFEDPPTYNGDAEQHRPYMMGNSKPYMRIIRLSRPYSCLKLHFKHLEKNLFN